MESPGSEERARDRHKGVAAWIKVGIPAAAVAGLLAFQLAIQPGAGPAGPSASSSSDPARVDAMLAESVQAFRAGDFRRTIDLNGSVLALQPGNADAYNNICSASNELGRYDDALAACIKALQLKPDHEVARANLNWALSKKQRAPK